MKVGWRFDRGQTEVGDTVHVLCAFKIEDDNGGGTNSTLSFVIPESAAQAMLADLAAQASPRSELTIARVLPDGNGRMP